MSAAQHSQQPTGSITPQEMPRLLERHVAVAQLRQAECDWNLLKAVQLGAALKRLSVR